MRPAVTADGESVGDDGERKSGRSREMIQWGHAAAALARTMTSVPAGGWSMSRRRRPLRRRRRRFHCRRRCCGFNSRAAASRHCANSCSVGPSSWPEYELSIIALLMLHETGPSRTRSNSRHRDESEPSRSTPRPYSI